MLLNKKGYLIGRFHHHATVVALVGPNDPLAAFWIEDTSVYQIEYSVKSQNWKIRNKRTEMLVDDFVLDNAFSVLWEFYNENS